MSCGVPDSSSSTSSAARRIPVARNQRDLRQQLHAQHQELVDDIRQRAEDVLGRLAHEAQELRSDKTDRKALALLTEMAMRLNGDIRALAPGDEVGV